MTRQEYEQTDLFKEREEYEKTEEFKQRLLNSYGLNKFSIAFKTLRNMPVSEFDIKGLILHEEMYPHLIGEHKMTPLRQLIHPDFHHLIPSELYNS